MTFDEAIKVLGEGLLTDKINFGDSTFVSKRNITNLDTIQIINDLRKEYAPTINMTQEEYEYFKTFRYTDSSFTQLSESIMKQGDLVKFGLKSAPLYLMGLPEEQLMQAWLHPESIKVIGEQNNEF